MGGVTYVGGGDTCHALLGQRGGVVDGDVV